MNRRHQILAAVVAGPFLGLNGMAVSDASAQTARAGLRAVKVSEQASSQHARIAGTIKDDNGAAIEGAIVTAVGFSNGLAVSDAAGRFSLALPAGEYQIRVHRDGYASNFRELLLLRSHVNITRSIVLQRTGERAVLTAGLGRAPALPGAGTGSKTHPHTEQAWRLRHLERSALRDTAAMPDGLDDADGMWTRAFGAPGRLASALFSDVIDGEFRLVSAGSIGPYAPAFAELSSAGVAYLSVRAPIGSHGEWSVRGTMSSADLGTWLVAGDYVATSTNTHAFNVGMSYGSQGMPAGDRTPMPVSAVFTDRTRNAGQLYAFDRWRMSPVLLVDYGTRVDYFDYLPARAVLWSPVLSVELTPWGEHSPTSFTLAASSRRDAPGSAEFTPPLAGPWLPPQRMFAALPGGGFDVERTDHAELAFEHRFDDFYTIGLRRFVQRTDNQVATLFGLDRPGLSTDGAHYYVASIGGASVDGWSVRLATPDGQAVRGSIDYAVADVEWTPVADTSALVGAAGRDGSERVHDLTTSLGADVPRTKTRMLVVYRVSNGYATLDNGPSLDARFDMQLNQGLPFLPSTAGEWEVLLSVKNTLRDQRFGMSMLDELLAVSTPTRVVGGVQVKF
ncbi:MAG: TonB-dependent receptor [Vicinamibacterales bacterium]